MASLVRIRQHPTDEDALILAIPHDLNYEMARFQPASLAVEHRGFVMLTEHLAAFQRFARTLDVRIIDERASAPGQKTLMPECDNCGQPARLTAQPAYCPDCGGRWVARFVHGDESYHGVIKACASCLHEQPRHFRHCAKCGARMPPDDAMPVRRILAQQDRLDAPMALSDVLHETVDELDDGPTVGEWAQLARLEIRPCNAPDHQADNARTPATDVALPEETV